MNEVKNEFFEETKEKVKELSDGDTIKLAAKTGLYLISMICVGKVARSIGYHQGREEAFNVMSRNLVDMIVKNDRPN